MWSQHRATVYSVRRERERETRQCVEPAQSYGIQCEKRKGEGDKTVWSQHRATVYSVRRERDAVSGASRSRELL